MAYFGTDRDKKSQDYNLCDKAKSHAARLSGAFRRVKGKSHGLFSLITKNEEWDAVQL